MDFILKLKNINLGNDKIACNITNFDFYSGFFSS